VLYPAYASFKAVKTRNMRAYVSFYGIFIIFASGYIGSVLRTEIKICSFHKLTRTETMVFCTVDPELNPLPAKNHGILYRGPGTEPITS